MLNRNPLGYIFVSEARAGSRSSHIVKFGNTENSDSLASCLSRAESELRRKTDGLPCWLFGIFCETRQQEDKLKESFKDHLMPYETEKYYVEGDVEKYLGFAQIDVRFVCDLEDVGLLRSDASIMPEFKPWEFTNKSQLLISSYVGYAKPLDRESRRRIYLQYPDDDWLPNKEIVEAARSTLGGFDIAPCCTIKTNMSLVRSANILPPSDGLFVPWGNRNAPTRAFIHPDFNGNQVRYTERCVSEWKAGHLSGAVLVLSSDGIRSSWWDTLLPYAHCITYGRIKLIKGSNNKSVGDDPKQRTVAIYFGNEQHKFAESFNGIGSTMIPVVKEKL